MYVCVCVCMCVCVCVCVCVYLRGLNTQYLTALKLGEVDEFSVLSQCLS
jgi:hypothetical protein